ncbi:hypothetical protein D3C77_511350 [compost metagenome]
MQTLYRSTQDNLALIDTRLFSQAHRDATFICLQLLKLGSVCYFQGSGIGQRWEVAYKAQLLRGMRLPAMLIHHLENFATARCRSLGHPGAQYFQALVGFDT